jgi:hypothetical protein
MTSITRHSINPKAVFHYHDKLMLIKSYTYEDICDRIDRWKMFYLEQYQVEAGQTILVDFHNMSVDYFASIFAALELGLVLVNRVPNTWRIQNGKDDEPIPATDINVDYILAFDIKSDWDLKLYNTLSKNVVLNEYWSDFQVKDKELLATVKDVIRASDDSVAAVDLTTQTTTSHKKLLASSQRLSTALGYADDDSILHTKNMHLLDLNLCWNLLAGFMTCREHYVFNDCDAPSTEDYFYLLGEFVKENEINCVPVTGLLTGALNSFLKELTPVSHTVKITTKGPVARGVLATMKAKNISVINRLYGNLPHQVGFFIKQITADSDPTRLQLNNFGLSIDDFYQFKIENNKLYYACPAFNEDWQTDGDLFIISNNEYHYAGN